jgi:predicted enzyme related to lactoylglutathione lyase
MGDRTEHPHGTFSWADLSTDDFEGAKTFYGGLFGWDFDDMPTGEGDGDGDGEGDGNGDGDGDEAMLYSMAKLDGKAVGAVFKGDGSLPVHWNSYVTVDDVDAMPEKVKAAGGEVTAEPFDVMESVGRMAVIQDPTGAFLNLWEAKDNIGAQLVNVPGALTWNDLNTTDPQKATDFYGEVFGWTFDKIPDVTEYWVIKNGDRSNGGVRPIDNSQPGDVPAHWLPYFACSDLDDALAKVEELGGRKFFGPLDLPSGRIAVVADPQGGAFALFSGEFDD